jgi:hypothetical protein
VRRCRSESSGTIVGLTTSEISGEGSRGRNCHPVVLIGAPWYRHELFQAGTSSGLVLWGRGPGAPPRRSGLGDEGGEGWPATDAYPSEARPRPASAPAARKANLRPVITQGTQKPCLSHATLEGPRRVISCLGALLWGCLRPRRRCPVSGCSGMRRSAVGRRVYLIAIEVAEASLISARS